MNNAQHAEEEALEQAALTGTYQYHMELLRNRMDAMLEPGGNTVNNLLVGVVHSFFTAMFLLMNAKLGHLVPGDPFLERIRVQVLFLATYFSEYLTLILPREEHNQEAPQAEDAQGGVIRRVATRVTNGVRTLLGRGRRTQGPRNDVENNDQDEEVEDIRQARATVESGIVNVVPTQLRIGYVALEIGGFTIYNADMQRFVGNCVNQDAHVGADRTLQELLEELRIRARAEAPELVRDVALLRCLRRRLDAFIQAQQQASNNYYVENLGCRLNVVNVVRHLMDNRVNEAIQFDFSRMLDTQEKMTAGVRAFYGATRGLETFDWGAEGRAQLLRLNDYTTVLQGNEEEDVTSFWQNAVCVALNPFEPAAEGEPELVMNEREDPTIENLIQVASDIARN